MEHPARSHQQWSEISISGCAALDQDYLERVTFGDVALRDELISLFLSQLSATILKLPIIRTQDDWRFTAHSLRGAAAAIGANEIASLCADWEKAGPPRLAMDKLAHSTALQAAEARFRSAKATLKS